jgi:hypothetical protein
MSWDDDLAPAEQQEWDQFVRHVREGTVRQMAGSAFVTSLVPQGKPDIKFAVELGLAIMMEKPLILLARSGRDIPPKLRKIADGVIVADPDTEAGQRKAAAAMQAAYKRLGFT